MIKEYQVKKKPLVVKTIQFTPDLSDHELRVWSNQKAFIVHLDRDDEPCAMINTIEGTMKAQYGDWIIMGNFNDVYPIREDIFNSNYDFVSER
jgi:hypothetical protein